MQIDAVPNPAQHRPVRAVTNPVTKAETQATTEAATDQTQPKVPAIASETSQAAVPDKRPASVVANPAIPATAAAVEDASLPATPAGPAVAAGSRVLAVPSVAPAVVTQHASYAVVPFSSLPGWNSDDPRASLVAFVRGCSVLNKRAVWREACQAAAHVDANDQVAARDLYQRYFTAYHIEDRDRNAQGLLTGYYESTLDGHSARGGKFIYPVYGVPSDLLFMDSRLLPALASQNRVAAHVEGRNVVPLDVVSSTDTRTLYVLDLRGGVIDIRDKKLRLRIDGNRIVPYFSRAEIERNGLKAPVLAYVSDPKALYAMQLQGNGQIRMDNGKVLRLSYAEQNGRPFTPRRAAPGDAGPTVRVRGIDFAMGGAGGAGGADASSTQASNGSAIAAGEAEGAGDASTALGAAQSAPQSTLLAGIDDAPESDGSVASTGAAVGAPHTRGFVLSNALASPGAPTTGAAVGTELAAAAPAPSSVNSWLAMTGGADGVRADAGKGADKRAEKSTDKRSHQADRRRASGRPADSVAGSGATAEGGSPTVAGISADARIPVQRVADLGNVDPNYVFFRETAEREGASGQNTLLGVKGRKGSDGVIGTNAALGPIGTLGVVLTAGQSVAVDPRTTPLGAPVFLADAPADSPDEAQPATELQSGKTSPPDAGRLMVAQDSSAAVRGAVRADYFYGAGPIAQSDANKTRRPVQMWVLLPKTMNLAAASKTAVRGEPAPLADCLVPDDTLCQDQ